MTIIKCPNCGIYNTDSDYCKECNTILSYKLRREHAFKKAQEERQKQNAAKEEKPAFFEKYLNHRYFLIRLIAKTIRSIWLVFMAIGMFIAWVVSAIAA
ncbi:hypothetical protein IA57_03935 [Mangrovimonas yunxiaonensis]|uniref:TFIIB-type zinc ribbon-containing protein n=1 Tax=Mangrovimonas yunxiaonensis TaxID=1197477 RepID=A0A084TMT5_9FLAO|nr:hypothetical protein [Mangrovimonas yunxiaonensis]KFB02021.1 hypothetical protein IA57_03935 [Mangrovimonas yunxiaonensis]GGH45384.1 hypothetical protein GCM10011364_18760 [Mangrovimonas yunxiaonensis]